MITDKILPFPQHIDTNKGIYTLFDDLESDYGVKHVDDKFIVKPKDVRASHCQTVKEYELFKFCNGQHGAVSFV